MENNEIIRKNIRFLRKLNNYSLVEFSNKIGVSKSLVSQIECGYGMFSLIVVQRIAELFNVSLDELVYVDMKENYVVKLEKIEY